MIVMNSGTQGQRSWVIGLSMSLFLTLLLNLSTTQCDETEIDIKYVWKYAWEKSRSPKGNQESHEIPATSQFMVGDKLTSELWIMVTSVWAHCE